ncbi:response regulator [Desulfobacterales bacterium HSG17]|nr:response regulator [Desulfobacterales bacterium HSG17]
MSGNQYPIDKFEKLRCTAKELIRQRHDVNKEFPTDILELIYELKIHQAELEIQNEELKRAQLELSELHHEFIDLYDSAPCGYVIITPSGIISRINLMGAELLGGTKKKIYLTSFNLYLAPGHEDFYFNARKKAGLTGEKQSLELKIKTDKESPVWVQADIQADRNETGEVIQWRMVLIDITKNKILEAQLYQSKKIESIGTLTGGIAHDFNNILYVITENAELSLEEIPEWNPVHNNIKEILKAGIKAAEIVKQLLNFSRQDDRQDLQSIEAVTRIKAAIKFFRPMIPASVEIRMNNETRETMILADSKQITQVMMNICINASQAMEETGGVIEIKLEQEYLTDEFSEKYPDLCTGHYLKITISDTGCGINPEIINNIFDPYFTTREFGKGSGMGLAVVHGIVKNHNGAIFVDSRPGKGSAFTILFPAISDKPPIEPEISNEIPRGSENILLVDDEESIVFITRTILEQLGYQVETRQDPKEALELFQSKPQKFDLVISDMTMPHMNGIILFEKLKEIRSDIPVIICTGHSQFIDKEKAEEMGGAAYVMKPVLMQELAETIRKVLDKILKNRQL